MHGDNVRKAIKDTDSRNKITEGVNKVHATAWYNQEGRTYPLEKSMKTDKDTKYTKKSGATPGKTVKAQVKKTKSENKSAEAYNTRHEMTNRKRKDEFKRSFGSKSTVPSVSFNHNWGKRKDGSSGPV